MNKSSVVMACVIALVALVIGISIGSYPVVPPGWRCTEYVREPNMGTKQQQMHDVCVAMRREG